MIKRAKHTILDFLPALSSTNFRLYTLGQGISLVGTWLANIAEQWLIYPVLTNNKSLIGIVSAVNLLPTAALVLFGGVIADRIDKRKISILVQALFGIISFMIGVLVYTHQIQIWHVMTAAFLSGVVFALDMPARNTLMFELVDKEHFPSAVALNSGMFNAARAIGPALAGFMIASVGIASAYILNAFSFVAVIISLLLLKLPPHENIHKGTSFKDGLTEGLLFIKRDRRLILLLILLAVMSGISWPLNTLFPIFAHDIFKTGEIGFGLMQSAFGIGAMITALGFAKLFERIQNKVQFMKITAFIMGLSFLILAITPSFTLALISLAITGIMSGATYGMINSLVQLETPNILRGRIMSIYSFVLFGSMPIGSLVISYGLKFAQAPTIVIIASTIMGVISLLILSQIKN